MVRAVAIGLGLLLAVPALGLADPPGTAHVEGRRLIEPAEVRLPPSGAERQAVAETIPPWGRDLDEPSPLIEPDAPVLEAPGHGVRIWATIEYLLWWTRNGSVPPLVTKGEPTDPRPGALDQPYTK